jgi:serine/threonine-protein kinase SRPK3
VKWGTSTGEDYLFDPMSGSQYSKENHHIVQTIELMGEIPAI